jgi:hypothetical protein
MFVILLIFKKFAPPSLNLLKLAVLDITSILIRHYDLLQNLLLDDKLTFVIPIIILLFTYFLGRGRN